MFVINIHMFITKKLKELQQENLIQNAPEFKQKIITSNII